MSVICNDPKNCEALIVAEDAIGMAAYGWIRIMYSG